MFHTIFGTLFFLPEDETKEEHRDELIRYRFLVPESFDDFRFAYEFRDLVRLLGRKKKAKNSFTILPTTDCNARCFYCYELGRARTPMPDEVAHDTAAHILKVSEGDLKILWFGGEPLLGRRAIDIITGELRAAGRSFTSTIATNGYYLDREMIETAVRDYHLERAQITLDGTREKYNRIKAYVERDSAAYDRVLQNIEDALKAGILVSIRLNMDADNADDLMQLSDELIDRFQAYRGRLSIYPRLLGEFVGKIHGFASEDEAVERYFALMEKLERAGFFKQDRLPRGLRVNNCMADNLGHELINPEGNIGCCEHNSDSDFVGSIYTKGLDEAGLAAWQELIEPQEECRTCPIFPDCTMLKKCEWTKLGCTAVDRRIRLHNLTGKVLRTYDEIRNGTYREQAEERIEPDFH